MLLQKLKYGDDLIRCLIDGDKVFICLKDVGRALGEMSVPYESSVVSEFEKVYQPVPTVKGVQVASFIRLHKVGQILTKRHSYESHEMWDWLSTRDYWSDIERTLEVA